MKQLYYQNEYIRAYFDKTNQIFEQIWLPETLSMTNKDYKRISYDIIDLYKKCCPQKVIADLRDLRFMVDPSHEKELAVELNKIALKMMAIVLPENLFSKIDVEETVEMLKKIGLNVEVSYFQTYEKAEEWLNNEFSNDKLDTTF
ncbi:hypothetical protein V6R21_16370 [Limibacter armeniacum]|uniref:hypothetical protein n=1 Tax=Limibacter armeniacum TaxID=466084 RepID=UPI002FE51B4D